MWSLAKGVTKGQADSAEGSSGMKSDQQDKHFTFKDATKIQQIVNMMRKNTLRGDSLRLDERGVPIVADQTIHEVIEKPHYIKTFVIGNKPEAVKVHIPQLIGESYGTYVWPAAIVLAQYIWNNRTAVKGRRVLEIGAGTALPGITAAKLGASVILSDTCQYPDAIESCKKSCLVNDIALPVKSITWGMFEPDLFDLAPVDIVLGSDCFFETLAFEDIIITVSFILRLKPTCQFWCSYQERSSNWNIDWLLHKWGLVCHEVELPELNTEQLLSSDSMHMYIINLSAKET